MNKSLSYVNLSLLFQHFDWDLTHQVLFLYILPSHHVNLWETSIEDWKMLVRWYRTDICSCKLSAKVFLMLYNPFLVPSLCKLNHISPCFIQISTKITCKQLIHFRKSHVFFELIPGVLGWSLNFNITYRFLLRRAVFPDYPFPCDYAHHIHLILEENFGGNPWKACKKWLSRQFILFLSLQIRKVFKWFSQ